MLLNRHDIEASFLHPLSRKPLEPTTEARQLPMLSAEGCRDKPRGEVLSQQGRVAGEEILCPLKAPSSRDQSAHSGGHGPVDSRCQVLKTGTA